MYEKGNIVPKTLLQDQFARFFGEKIKTITAEVLIDEGYNGRVKVGVMNKMYMNPKSVKEKMS
jgi:hypothetical protein